MERQENKPIEHLKQLARLRLNNQIRAGGIKRKPCVKCGKAKSQGHHPNYYKPLHVIWLCKKHHAELHRKQTQKYVKIQHTSGNTRKTQKV